MNIKIEYIWIKKYDCLCDEGLRFSLCNEFKYDKTNNKIEHITHKKRYIDFFNDKDSSNNIQDVIAIVGDNGNGKTTVLKLIADIIRFNGDYNLSDFIIIISENGINFKIYTTIYDLIIPKFNEDYKLTYESFTYDYHDNISEIANKLNLIYYSNAFDNSSRIDDSINHKNIFDISTMHMIKKDKTSENSDDSLKSHIQSEYKRQIEFVTSYQNSEKHLKFDIPKKIYIDTKGIDSRMSMLINLITPDGYYKNSNSITEDEYRNREILVEVLGSIKYKFNESIKKYRRDIPSYTKVRLLYLHLVKSLESNIKNLEFSRIDTIEINEIFDLAEELDKDNIINSYIEYEKKNGALTYEFSAISILDDIEKNNILDPLDLDYINDILRYDIDKLIDLLDRNNPKLSKKVKQSKKSEIDYIKSNVLEMFKILCLDGIYEGMVEIFWPLSTGEYNLLSLYSRLHDLYKSIDLDESNERNILLLLDEGESTLHPRWQQQYVKSIIDLIDDIFDNTNVQIILTTHSPIILSDIPGDNVIYLNKNNKNTENLKTFGANIYDLYNNSFFLDNSVTTGVIGTFADEKIKDIIKRLNNIENKLKNKTYNKNIYMEEECALKNQLKEIKIIIDLIGEKIVKDILLDKYIEVKKLLNRIENEESKIKDIYSNLNPAEKKELIRLLLDEDM